VLRAVQQLLLDALLSDDPVAALAGRLEAAEGLADEERAFLRGLDADGLRLTGLLVLKLRYERVAGSDKRLAEGYREGRAEFLRRFEEYRRSVAPSAYFPSQEGELFAHWLAGSTRRTGPGQSSG
jgi:hypothetical protein